jgi:hypothetical protein
VLVLTPSSGGSALVGGTVPTGGSINWRCGTATSSDYKYLPANCRQGVS